MIDAWLEPDCESEQPDWVLFDQEGNKRSEEEIEDYLADEGYVYVSGRRKYVKYYTED